MPLTIAPTSGQITDHFYWNEVTESDMAARLDIDNTLPPDLVPVIISTARKAEKIRALLNEPMKITSWYRSLALNTALRSKPTSQHIKGEAIDFTSPSYSTPLSICRRILNYRELIPFDQLILEHTWVHVSFLSDPTVKPRGEVLSLLQSGGYATGLTDKQGKPL